MAKVLSPFQGHVGPLPSADRLLVGTFAGEYSDCLLASLVASCMAQPKPLLQSCGRDLQPYFNAAEVEEPSKAKPKADAKKKERKGSSENTAPPKELKTAAGDRALASPRRPNKRSKSSAKSPPRVAPSELTTCQPAVAAVGPPSPPPSEMVTGRLSVVSPSPSLKLENRQDCGAGNVSPSFAGPGYVKSPPPTNVPMPTTSLLILLGECNGINEPATAEVVVCS